MARIALMAVGTFVPACATSSALETELTARHGCIGAAEVPAKGTKEDAIYLARQAYMKTCLGGRELADNVDMGIQYRDGTAYVYPME